MKAKTERNQEMYKMRYVDGMTLNEIGKVKGISRERVRQIIGNTGREFRSNWTKELIQSRKVHLAHWTDLKNAPGVKREWQRVWGQERHEVRGGSPEVGFYFEELASVILAENGVSNMLMPNRGSYDIEAENGARIEVTVSNTDVSKMSSQNKCVYPTFSIPHRYNDCDFLFAFIPDKQEEGEYTYYIIPIYELIHLQGNDPRIRIPHPPMSQKKSKWHQYHKRIDLIKNYTV